MSVIWYWINQLATLIVVLCPSSTDKCTIDQFLCGSGECIPSYYRCNFGTDCMDGTDESVCGTDCNFETGLCGWVNSAGLPMKWTAQQGPTQTVDTGKYTASPPFIISGVPSSWLVAFGRLWSWLVQFCIMANGNWLCVFYPMIWLAIGPMSDHTFGNASGTYYYVEASTTISQLGDKAHLETDMYISSASKCKLTFWYNMYGDKMGDLNVYMKTEIGQLQKLWSQSGNQGQSWKYVSINFDIVSFLMRWYDFRLSPLFWFIGRSEYRSSI